MDTFDRAALWRLANHHEGPCISLFLETHPAGKDGEQDTIRLKNLLREADHQLSGHWVSAANAKALVEQPANLCSEPSFWQNRSQGLAIFVAPQLFRAYRVSIPLTAQVAVADRFRVRPLLPLLEQRLSFFLLVISENQVAFYSVDEQSIEIVQVPGLPKSLTESLNYVSADRGSQVHSAMHGVTGKQAAVFHGQGGQPDMKQTDLLAYCNDIDKKVAKWLGHSRSPLLLAGVESLTTLYRQRNSYKYLLDEAFTGNHDHHSEHELQAGAWSIVQPHLESKAANAAQLYAERVATQKTNDDPSEVVSAACQGRVDCLLYDSKAELFGRYDEAVGATQVTGKADEDDLIDLAAIETLRQGGTIHSMTGQDVPSNSPLAAILRY